MTIELGSNPPRVDASLLARLKQVEAPTFGHFLESGFFHHSMRRLAGDTPIAGRAVTVSAPSGDSTLVHYAISLLEEGDVLVISTHGNDTHAVMGGFAIAGLQAAGASAVVIDGVCTDLSELQGSGIAVYALGTTALTTKMLGIDAGGINVPIECAGVQVLPGHLIVGNENGVFAADSESLTHCLTRAEQSDRDEPGKIRRILAGEPLHDLSPSGELLKKLGLEIA